MLNFCIHTLNGLLQSPYRKFNQFAGPEMIAANEAYDCANATKAKFEAIYNAPDPRSYYTTLDSLDYQIPTNAKPVFQRILSAMPSQETSKIVDVGCSYGVNAAMLRYDLTFSEMAVRYRRAASQNLSVAETVMRDAQVFSDLDPACDAEFVGLDIARQAAGYADAVGLIDEAIVEDLEAPGLSDHAASALNEANLVISTGAIGYVGEETLGKIVDASGKTPWIAAFVLRQFPFDAIAERLADLGLVTEKLPDTTFLQRRFRDDAEQEGAIEALRAAGREPDGLESEGFYHAEFYLARPAGEIAAPIVDMKLI